MRKHSGFFAWPHTNTTPFRTSHGILDTHGAQLQLK
jgi:hypothetical protein